jgi:muramidase (phage lysozyme)
MATLKADPILEAFLDLIAESEGTSSSPITRADGYDIIVEGIDGRHSFTDFSGHPFGNGRPPIIVRSGRPARYEPCDGTSTAAPKLIEDEVYPLESTASGRYQFIWPTWKALAAVCHLGTFSPEHQDIGCMQLLHTKGIDELLVVGELPKAIETASSVWASFPGNLFGQGGHSVEWLTSRYHQLLIAGKQ